MVLYESICAAALSVGSAVCLVKLLSHQQALNSSGTSSSDAFLAMLLITFLMGTFALWTVKGPHACWHPSTGSPWRGGSSSTLSAVAPSTEGARARAPAGDGNKGRVAKAHTGRQAHDDTAGESTTQPINLTVENHNMASSGEITENITSRSTAVPQQCSDDEDGDASEDEELPIEDERLERQSSFVVSYFWSVRGLLWKKGTCSGWVLFG